MSLSTLACNNTIIIDTIFIKFHFSKFIHNYEGCPYL